jgi:hypothetical protein
MSHREATPLAKALTPEKFEKDPNRVAVWAELKRFELANNKCQRAFRRARICDVLCDVTLPC